PDDPQHEVARPVARVPLLPGDADVPRTGVARCDPAAVEVDHRVRSSDRNQIVHARRRARSDVRVQPHRSSARGDPADPVQELDVAPQRLLLAVKSKTKGRPLGRPFESACVYLASANRFTRTAAPTRTKAIANGVPTPVGA